MKNVVLLGGNGYIGKELIKYWNKKEKGINFYVISRNAQNVLSGENIKKLIGDASNYDSIKGLIPEKVDYVINLIGVLEKDEKLLIEKNRKPVQTMIKIAKEKNVKAMGFIGGLLGPKKFTEIKKSLIQELISTNIPVAYVEPTIVYGNGRNDKLAKLIPIFKFLGLFNKTFKPVLVDDVVRDLVNNIEKY